MKHLTPRKYYVDTGDTPSVHILKEKDRVLYVLLPRRAGWKCQPPRLSLHLSPSTRGSVMDCALCPAPESEHTRECHGLCPLVVLLILLSALTRGLGT